MLKFIERIEVFKNKKKIIIVVCKNLFTRYCCCCMCRRGEHFKGVSEVRVVQSDENYGQKYFSTKNIEKMRFTKSFMNFYKKF